jgi:uncharacterized membrane protein
MNATQIVLALHVTGGSLALIGGFAALFSRKGGWLHRRAGILFVYAMLLMGAGAMALGAARGKYGNLLSGPLVAYFVITALTTVRPPANGSRRLDVGLMLLAAAIGTIDLANGAYVSATPTGRTPDGVPGGMILFIGTVTALAALGDVRVLRSGPLQGRRRLSRHLWRMCFAFFMASGSFFLGQMKVIPEPLRIVPLLAILAILPLVAMPYWFWRLRGKRAALPTSMVVRPTGTMIRETMVQ